MKKTLKFKNAPINELVFGVHFDELDVDDNYKFLFYESIKDEYPSVTENPPLNSIIEKKDKLNYNIPLKGFNTRHFFINKDNDKLIQLQKNRFLFNWRKTENMDNYPHFNNVYKDFDILFGMLENKLNKALDIKQLEVTYYDHIYLESFELKNYDLSKIFSFWNSSEQFNQINLSYSIFKEEINGNLNIDIKSANRKDDNKKLIVLNSTCRGMFLNNQSFKEWFDVSHNILLEYFFTNITEKAKTIWGLE